MSDKPLSSSYIESLGYEESDLVGYSCYGDLKIPGLLRHDNILGAQFHPEKSGEDGLAILRYFKEEFV